MFITTKKHNKIVKQLQDEKVKLYAELQEAKSFKDLIEKLCQPKSLLTASTGTSYLSIGGSWNPLESDNTVEIKIKENIATLVADELSKEIIVKQMSTKIVFLDKEGNIQKSGYTKQKADKGFSYKLIRE